jgi:hypothetical protein
MREAEDHPPRVAAATYGVAGEIRMSKREPANHPPRRAGCEWTRKEFPKEKSPSPFRIFGVFRGQIVFFVSINVLP